MLKLCMAAFAAVSVVILATQSLAQTASYPEEQGFITGSVGHPEVVTFDPETVEDGDYEISRDLLTGSRLFYSILEGKVASAYLMSGEQRFDLKKTDFVAACSLIHCASNQIPTCYQIEPSGCHCACGGDFRLQR